MPFDFDYTMTSILIFLLFVAVIAIIAFTIYKIVKIVCLTIARNTEVKVFGSSEEYTEFLQWKQEQGRQ